VGVPSVGYKRLIVENDNLFLAGMLAHHRPLAKDASRVSLYFEELDYRPTPIGALSLRRRRELSLGVDIFEIKLGSQYLMSSLFTASEIALARLGLAALSGPELDVVVGGLGLGYTAQEVLEHSTVIGPRAERVHSAAAGGKAGPSAPGEEHTSVRARDQSPRTRSNAQAVQ
jgi:hypothetical protein